MFLIHAGTRREYLLELQPRVVQSQQNIGMEMYDGDVHININIIYTYIKHMIGMYNYVPNNRIGGCPQQEHFGNIYINHSYPFIQ